MLGGLTYHNTIKNASDLAPRNARRQLGVAGLGLHGLGSANGLIEAGVNAVATSLRHGLAHLHNQRNELLAQDLVGLQLDVMRDQAICRPHPFALAAVVGADERLADKEQFAEQFLLQGFDALALPTRRWVFRICSNDRTITPDADVVVRTSTGLRRGVVPLQKLLADGHVVCAIGPGQDDTPVDDTSSDAAALDMQAKTMTTAGVSVCLQVTVMELLIFNNRLMRPLPDKGADGADPDSLCFAGSPWCLVLQEDQCDVVLTVIPRSFRDQCELHGVQFVWLHLVCFKCLNVMGVL